MTRGYMINEFMNALVVILPSKCYQDPQQKNTGVLLIAFLLRLQGWRPLLRLLCDTEWKDGVPFISLMNSAQCQGFGFEDWGVRGKD